MRIKLYLDEDVPSSFAQALINRGVDVIITQQAKNDSNSDLQQLIYATK
jgi:predicted Fe-Mo cluster-binding NifX family protein